VGGSKMLARHKKSVRFYGDALDVSNGPGDVTTT